MVTRHFGGVSPSVLPLYHEETSKRRFRLPKPAYSIQGSPETTAQVLAHQKEMVVEDLMQSPKLIMFCYAPYYVSMSAWCHTPPDFYVTIISLLHFNKQELLLTFFCLFVKKRTHGREELGAYACAINSKVEVSVLWGSLVLTEHFIRHCFAFFFFFPWILI